MIDLITIFIIGVILSILGSINSISAEEDIFSELPVKFVNENRRINRPKLTIADRINSIPASRFQVCGGVTKEILERNKGLKNPESRIANIILPIADNCRLLEGKGFITPKIKEQQEKHNTEYTDELSDLDPYNEDEQEVESQTNNISIDDLFFKKEEEVIYTDKNTGLIFKLPNNKMIIIYIHKNTDELELFEVESKIGMVKLKSNMSMNKGDMKKVVKRINDDFGLDKNLIEDAFETCEERLLLMPEPTMNGEDFKSKLLNKPDDKKALNDLGQAMKRKYLIIRAETGHYYYYDNYYKPMDVGIYQVLIEQEYRLHLSLNEVKRSLDSISGINKINHNIWVMADNTYYNPIKKTISKKPVLTDHACELTNGELANYNPEVKIFNKKPTLMETTLREILIPKNNPKDTELYLTFLKLLSKSLVIGNKTKSINILYNPKGDNAKSMLVFIQNLIFGYASATVRPKDIGDNFFYSRIKNTNTLIFDEVEQNSFDKYIEELKNISGNVRNDARKAYKDDRGKDEGYGTIFIMTNKLPTFPINNMAFIQRLNIYKVPNQFVVEDEITEDYQYPVNDTLKEQLEQDIEGQEWLFNVLIKMSKENYQFKKQTYEETKAIMIKENKVKSFIHNNFELTEFGTLGLTNKQIRQILKTENINIELNEQGQAILIGSILNELFGDKLRKNSSNDSTQYNIQRIKR